MKTSTAGMRQRIQPTNAQRAACAHRRKSMYFNAVTQPPEMEKRKEIGKIGSWASKQKYNTYVTSSIQRNLRARTDGKTEQERETMNSKYKPERQTTLLALVDAAVKEQTEIGWKHFSGGRLSKKWQESMELHHEDRLRQDPKAKLTPCSSLIAKTMGDETSIMEKSE